MCGGRDWNTGAVKEHRTASRVSLETCSMKAPDFRREILSPSHPSSHLWLVLAHRGYWGDLSSKEEPRTKHSLIAVM